MDGIELSDQWEDVFATPPINDYDVILRLNQKWLRPEVGTIKKKHTTKYGHGLTIRKEDQYVVFFFLSLSLSFPSSSPHASHRLTLSLLSLLSLSSLSLCRYANLSTSSQTDTLLSGFHPLSCYIARLRKTFGHVCSFFIDELSCDYVGVVFRRSIVRKNDGKKRIKKSLSHPFTAVRSFFFAVLCPIFLISF